MTESPRPQPKPGRTTKEQSGLSASMLIFVTALDTTWRAFIPTLGGVFLGIGIDHLFTMAPVGTITCLILGVVTSALLIAKQLRDVRKSM